MSYEMLQVELFTEDGFPTKLVIHNHHAAASVICYSCEYEIKTQLPTTNLCRILSCSNCCVSEITSRHRSALTRTPWAVNAASGITACHINHTHISGLQLFIISMHPFTTSLTHSRDYLAQKMHSKMSVFNFLHQLTTQHCLYLLLSAVMLQSIDISWPPGPQLQTSHSSVWRSNDGVTRVRFRS